MVIFNEDQFKAWNEHEATHCFISIWLEEPLIKVVNSLPSWPTRDFLCPVWSGGIIDNQYFLSAKMTLYLMLKIKLTVSKNLYLYFSLGSTYTVSWVVVFRFTPPVKYSSKTETVRSDLIIIVVLQVFKGFEGFIVKRHFHGFFSNLGFKSAEWDFEISLNELSLTDLWLMA